MDDALSRLERAHTGDPDDPTVRVELARAYVRVGRPARALAVLGPLDPGEREAAGRALAAAMSLDWVGVVEGADRFRTDGGRLWLVLVHAGAFLEDGETYAVSSLLERQSRSDLRRVVLPAFLAGVETRWCREGAVALAQQAGGRLATAAEWKKLWRGGLYLDGDASARVPNPDPDRLTPSGAPPELGRSPYGTEHRFDAYEVVQGNVAGLFFESTGRYFVPLTPDWRDQRVWRLVRDVPRALT